MKIPNLALGRRRNSATPTPPASMLNNSADAASSSSSSQSSLSSTKMGRSKSQRSLKDQRGDTVEHGRPNLRSSDSARTGGSSSSSSATTKRRARSKSQRGLDKWKDQLSVEDQHALAVSKAATPRTPRVTIAATADDSDDANLMTSVCSPRWVDDSADDNVKRFRTGAQVSAMASLYVTNPAVFSS